MTARLASRLNVSATQRLMLRGLGLFVLAGVVGAAVASVPAPRRAIPSSSAYTGTVGPLRDIPRPAAEHDVHELTRLELERANTIEAFAAEYGITREVATLIYDTALREGIDPDLGFRLVRIESGFRPAARSTAGAIGLTQVMLPTARFYDRTITPDQLADPETNLRIGFRYLRHLLERYEWDLRTALLAYNRGPSRVGELLARGQDPRNGYASSVTAGYRPPTGPILP